MPTMSDVAKEAGVSRSTVSIIVNEKQKERKILPETCNKVYAAMKKLSYRPNVNARRIKDSADNPLMIALYWPSDYRMNYLSRFMQGILTQISEKSYDCELSVRPYHYDNLENESAAIIRGNYNGVIIVGGSKYDIDFLDSINPPIPIVLINRESLLYTSVSVNGRLIAEEAVNLLMAKNYQQSAVLIAEAPAAAAGLRMKHFINLSREKGIDIPEEYMFYAPNSIEGGAEAAHSYLAKDNPPKVIFCDCDYMAMGFIHECSLSGVAVPDDLEVIAVGMLPNNYTEFYTPSITVIALPLEELSAKGIDVIMDALKTNQAEPQQHNIDSYILIRQSFQT